MTDETMITAAEARALALARQRHADGYHMAKMPHAAIEDVGALLRALEASEAALKASEARVESAYRDGWEDSERAECFDRVEDYLTAYLAALSPEEGG